MSVAASLTSISTLLQAVFTAGLLVVAAVAAGFAYRQLTLQTQVARRERVYALADRTADLEFVVMMNDALTLMRMTPSARADALAAPDATQRMLQAITILNFFEEVAGEYLDGLLDKPVANKNVAALAVGVWKDAREFIDWFRDTRQEDASAAWDRLQTLGNTWEAVRGG